MKSLKTKLNNLTKKQIGIISSTIAIWGIILISSGSIIASQKPKTIYETKAKIIQKRVSEIKNNEIKLKDIEQEIKEPISVDIKDYLENIENLDKKTLKNLKLDTSLVNINEAGVYTYTVTYKNKKFNGTFTVKEKELPNANITLKNLNLPVGSTLATDIKSYVNENLSDEIIANAKLDISTVNPKQSGNYQYTISYKGKIYTGTIVIYQPQTNTTPQNKDKDKPEEPAPETPTEEPTP